MGLFDLIHGEGDDPAELVTHRPAVLLPALASPEQVADLVRAWNPTANTSGLGQEVAPGIRWYGPIPLDDERLELDALPAGYAAAYVARSESDRILRTGFSRRLQRWAQRFTDSGLGLDPSVTAEADRDLERDFPGGLPTGAEAHAWNLVRGIARSLGGIALLPGNPSYTPSDGENPGAVVWSAHALTPEEALPLLEDLLPGLAEKADQELISEAGFWLLSNESVSVVADRIDGDDRPPAVRHLGKHLVAYDATASDDALEAAVAARLAGATAGIVLDEFGFHRPHHELG